MDHVASRTGMTPDDNPSTTRTAADRTTAEGEDPFRSVRLAKLETLRRLGIDPYPVAFDRTDEAAALEQRYADLAVGVETTDRVRVAGRIRAIRNSGMFI